MGHAWRQVGPGLVGPRWPAGPWGRSGSPTPDIAGWLISIPPWIMAATVVGSTEGAGGSGRRGDGWGDRTGAWPAGPGDGGGRRRGLPSTTRLAFKIDAGVVSMEVAQN